MASSKSERKVGLNRSNGPSCCRNRKRKFFSPIKKGVSFMRLSWILDLISLIVGIGTWYTIFAYSFFGSPIAFAIIGFRAICAFALSRVSKKMLLEEKAWHLSLRFLLLESGSCLMILWAFFNFIETHRTGFDITYWVVPIILDRVAWRLGQATSST